MSYILGRGSYGTIISDPNSKTCRKLFSKDKGYSFLREAYIIKSLSHTFIKNVSCLLWSCGIYNQLYNEYINFISKDIYLPKIYKIFIPSDYTFKIINYGQLINNYNCKSNKKIKLDNYSNNDFYYIPIINIYNTNKQLYMYDIEIEEIHEFLCNGFLTSNSSEIAIGSIHNNEFLNLKNLEINPDRSDIYWMSNNSVILYEKEDFLKIYKDYDPDPETTTETPSDIKSVKKSDPKKDRNIKITLTSGGIK